MDMKDKPITKDDLKSFNREFLEDFTYSLMQQMVQMNKQMALLTEQVNVLNQEKYLLGCLSHPRIPLDNNEAERKIRNFVISRKNFVLIDTVNEAEASAIMFSLSETVKANKLKPYEYFEYVLSEMPKYMRRSSHDLSFLDDLMPWSDKLPDRLRKTEK